MSDNRIAFQCADLPDTATRAERISSWRMAVAGDTPQLAQMRHTLRDVAVTLTNAVHAELRADCTDATATAHGLRRLSRQLATAEKLIEMAATLR